MLWTSWVEWTQREAVPCTCTLRRQRDALDGRLTLAARRQVAGSPSCPSHHDSISSRDSPLLRKQLTVSAICSSATPHPRRNRTNTRCISTSELVNRTLLRRRDPSAQNSMQP